MFKKFKITAFGCPMQKSDAERITFFMESLGLKQTKDENEADILIYCMCSVRQSAVDRIYGILKKLPKDKLKILAGCILEKDKKVFEKYFDFIWQARPLFHLPPKPSSKEAYIQIATGCNYRCAYCVVPLVRGREILRKKDEILKEAKDFIKKGYKMLWLVAPRVTCHPQLKEIIEELENFKENFWLGITAPHPADFRDDLIETLAKSKKVIPHLSLPLQSASNKILKKMRRNYKKEDFEKTVKKLKKSFQKERKELEAHLSLSTDIIVGFPGETKKDFEETLNFLKKIRFEMAYIAEYSPRPGTEAFSFKETVPEKEKVERRKALEKILREIAFEENKRFLGKEIEVFVRKKRKNFFLGKSRHQKTVKFKAKNNENLLGKIVKVKIKNIKDFGLEGEI